MEFTQLTELRRQAEGWRTGLSGLTALLAVLAVLKGRDSLEGLPDAAAYTAAGLLAAAFVLLLAGAVLAIRAAHGRPSDEIYLGGQALRRWTSREAAHITTALRRASVCCVLGVLLAAASVAVAWATTGDHAASGPLVQVRTTGGAVVCGEFVSAGPHGTVVLTHHGGVPRLATVPPGSVASAVPVPACS
jgi:hypothetical protein